MFLHIDNNMKKAVVCTHCSSWSPSALRKTQEDKLSHKHTRNDSIFSHQYAPCDVMLHSPSKQAILPCCLYINMYMMIYKTHRKESFQPLIIFGPIHEGGGYLNNFLYGTLYSMQGYLQEVQVAQEVQLHPKESKQKHPSQPFNSAKQTHTLFLCDKRQALCFCILQRDCIKPLAYLPPVGLQMVILRTVTLALVSHSSETQQETGSVAVVHAFILFLINIFTFG